MAPNHGDHSNCIARPSCQDRWRSSTTYKNRIAGRWTSSDGAGARRKEMSPMARKKGHPCSESHCTLVRELSGCALSLTFPSEQSWL